MKNRTPSSAARQIAAELGQSSPKGTARLAVALSGTKPVATLVNTRMEVPSPSRGRPSYRWVDACYVVRPDGVKEYPPVRIREAWSRCASEGWAFKVVSESEYKPESKPKDEPERITTKALAAQYQELCDKSSHRNGLWKGTYGDTARILRTYSRSRAIYHLEKLAERYKFMSLSSVYAQAANNLREYAGGAC